MLNEQKVKIFNNFLAMFNSVWGKILSQIKIRKIISINLPAIYREEGEQPCKRVRMKGHKFQDLQAWNGISLSVLYFKI